MVGGQFTSFAVGFAETEIYEKNTVLEIIFRHSFAKCQNRCQPCQLGVNLGDFGTDAAPSRDGRKLLPNRLCGRPDFRAGRTLLIRSLERDGV